MEELKQVMPNKIDYTALSTFLVCRKKYYLRLVRGIVGKLPPTAAEFGRCIHKALDIWYTTQDKEKATATFVDSFVPDPTDEKRTREVGVKLLSLYYDKYQHEGFKVIASETPFEVPLFGDNTLIGRIDKIIEWDGVLYIMDHKTTSRLGYEYFYKIKPNMQFDGYVYAARKLGYNAQGVVLDALLVAKGLLVPSQLAKLTPLARDISMRTDEDIEIYLENVNQILYDIKRCYDTGIWYQNTESCCNFVECPYRKICKEEKALQERIIEMDYKIEHWDPTKELINGTV